MPHPVTPSSPRLIQETGYLPQTKFGHFKNMIKAPYVVYADTESIIRPTTTPTTNSNTTQTSEHVPCSFAYVIIRSDGRVHSELYSGEDAMDVFFQQLEEELVDIRKDLKNRKTIGDDERRLGTGTEQLIFVGFAVDHSDRTRMGTATDYGRLRTTDHITGEYRGAAHSKCNLLLRIEPYHTPIPVFFHNLKNYDAHHLMSAIGRTEQ